MSDEQNKTNEVVESQESEQEQNQEQEQAQSASQSSADKFDINTVIQDAIKIATDPVGFYRAMPTSGGFVNPMIFVAVMMVATVVVGFVFNLIGLAKFNPMFGTPITIGMLIVLPIVAVIGSFIGAAILFVIWKLMGSEKDYETAYRCMAYTTVIGPPIAAISFLPYIAGILKTLWGAFLLYVASIEVHKIKDSTAKIVFGILAALLVISGISSERTYRKYSTKFERISEQMERQFEEGTIGNALKDLEDVEDMTPEEAGKKFGEFLKGMEEFSKGVEDSVKEEDQSND